MTFEIGDDVPADPRPRTSRTGTLASLTADHGADHDDASVARELTFITDLELNVRCQQVART
jgi:hypothetical protein